MSRKRKLTSFRKKYLRFRISEQRRKLKLRAIEYCGGQCKYCGYDKCAAALVFHHLDPHTKEFGISSNGLIRSFDKIKVELDKCILLCSNCHYEEHAKEYENNRQAKLAEINLEKKVFKKSKIVGCDFCKEKIKKYASSIRKKNFCSTKCKKLYFRDKIWITNDQLKEELKTLSIKQISFKYKKALRTVYKKVKKIKIVL